MEWLIWITRWFLFCIRYSRLFWVYFYNIDDPSIRIYVNKIENRITFRIKTRYYLELLTHEAMKLLWSTKNKITNDKNGRNVPNLEITEVVLVQWYW